MFVRGFNLAGLALLGSLTFSIPAAAADDGLRAAFDRAAKLDGNAYAVARDILANQDESVLPILDEKARSTNWRERYLAEALRLRIREPEKAVRWRWTLLYWNSRLRLNDSGQLVTTLPDEAATAAAAHGEKLVPGEVVLDKEAIPIIIDCLREFSSGNSFAGGEHVVSEALVALRRLHDPGTAAPIIHYLYGQEEQALQTLVSFGKPALPALHAALADAAKPWPQPQRAELAARVLAQIGDATSAELLVAGLDKLASPSSLPVFCAAISRLQPVDGPEVLFRQLHALAFERANDARNLDADIYLAVRDALLALGDAAQPVLSKNQTADTRVETRAIANGMAYELAHAAELESLFAEAGREWITAFPDWAGRVEDGEAELSRLGRVLFWKRSYATLSSQSLLAKAPAPLLIEAAAVTRDEQLVERLSNLPGNDAAFELLEWLLLTERPNWATRRGAILPLAQISPMKTIDVYRAFIQKHPLTELDRIVEGAVLVGDRQAGVFLGELLEHKDAKRSFVAREQQAAAIRRIADVLQNEPQNLAKLLELDEPAYRFAAARVLANRGDPSCVPLLFSAAVQAAAGDQRSTTSLGPQQAQDVIVRIGEPAIDAIDKAAAQSEAKYADLLAEVLKLRIRNPQLARRFQQAMNRQWPGFNYRAGPDHRAYQSAGKQVAKTLGQDGIPLLEGTLVWNPNSSGARIAAFALAEFKQDRSLEVIVAHAGYLGWVRRESIAAAVLKGFGEKGIAAAKNVDAPDPDKMEFDRRRGRHRAATSALTLAGEAEGVEGVLAGLNLVAEGKVNSVNARIYLNLAAKYEDKRLIPAVIAAAEKLGGSVSRETIAALAPYDDPRLVPVFVRLLRDRYADDDALLGLARIKGDATASFLLDQLKQSNDHAIQIGIVQALAKLHPDRGFVARAKIDQETVKQLVPEISAALIEQVSAKDAAIQTQAAESLAQFLQGYKDSNATTALVDWMGRQDDPSRTVLEYLVSTRDPAVAPALLKSYREDPLKRAHLAAHLATLKNEAARDDIVAALRQRLAAEEPHRNTWRIPEVEVLAGFDEQGRDSLFDITTTENNLQFRVESYNALARQRYEKVLRPMADVLQELVQNGLWDPRVERHMHNDRSQAYRFLVTMLAEGLIALDPNRAYPLIARACLEIDDEDARNQLAYQLRALSQNKPELKQANVALDSTNHFPGGDADADLDVPLLAACDIWLEAITEHHHELPPGVRIRMMARGHDSLLVGVELFYEFPVPTKDQMAQAVADLTSQDEAVRREAAAMLAVRKYPASLLDEAIADVQGETLARGEAIRRWRQRGGRILDANSTTRSAFTNMLLVDWPIDQMREFTIAHLDLLATISHEAYIWSEKPLFPLLLSVRYSPARSERARLDEFIERATPEAKKIASSVQLQGFGGFYGTNVARWGPLPAK